MTARDRDFLKSRFELNDVPPEADWQDLIDSFLLVTEGFTYHEIETGPTATRVDEIRGPLHHVKETGPTATRSITTPTNLSLT